MDIRYLIYSIHPNTWTHGIKKGDPLHLWYVDEEWAFLAKGKQHRIFEPQKP